MGLEILPPDINLSGIKYTGKERSIRVGFMQIKELSLEAKDAVIHERERNGPFRSLEDFLNRTVSHVHLQDARTLIKAGCFDGISQGVARPGLVWKALRFFERKGDEKNPGLFDRHQRPVPVLRREDRQGRYPERLMLKHESETLGFVLSAHPLDLYQDLLKDMDPVSARDLRRHVGRQVTMAGWLVTGKTVSTKAGDPMKFISFEDATGIYEAVLFPKVYDRYCHMLNASRPYIIKGRVEEDFGSVNVNVHWIGFLDR